MALVDSPASGNGGEEADFMPILIASLDLTLFERRDDSTTRDRANLYLDSFSSESGDNGKIDTNASSTYYHGSGRLTNLPTAVYMAGRSGVNGDEFNDGSLNTNLWNKDTDTGDTGTGTDTVSHTFDESGGTIYIEAKAEYDDANGHAKLKSSFSTGTIMCFKVTNANAEISDDGINDEGKVRVVYGGSTILQDREYKDSDRNYNRTSINGGCQGTHTIIGNGDGTSTLYTNGSHNDNLSSESAGINFESILNDPDSSNCYIEVDYVETWDWADGSLVATNVESLSTVESCFAHLQGVFPDGTTFTVDFSLDGGTTWPEKLQGYKLDEIKYFKPEKLWDDNVSGNNLAVRVNVSLPSNHETPKIKGMGVKSWDN